MHVRADVASTSFNEVTFQVRTPGGGWRSIGTDDTAPYQVFHDTSTLRTGTRLQYRAVVLEIGKTAESQRSLQSRASSCKEWMCRTAEAMLWCRDVL